MNFRNPNKKRLQFSIDPRNIRTPYLKIIEFSILPLPTPSPLRRIESINMPANELSIKPAGQPPVSPPAQAQPTRPPFLSSHLARARARTYTRTHIRNQEIEPPLYIDIDSMEGRGEGGIETSPGKQTADERGEPRNIPVMRHGVKKRACWPH